MVQIDTQQLPSTGTGVTVRDVPAEVSTCSVGSGFTPVVLTEGNQIFVDALTLFADQSPDPRLKSIITRVAAPERVAGIDHSWVGRGRVDD